MFNQIWSSAACQEAFFVAWLGTTGDGVFPQQLLRLSLHSTLCLVHTMKPWWLHRDPNLSSAIIRYEDIPADFLGDTENSEHPIFPPLVLSVTDFLDKRIPSFPDTSTVSLHWSHERPQQTPSPTLLLALPLPSLEHIDSFFRVLPPPNATSLSLNSLRFDLSLGPILRTWLYVVVRWGEWHETMVWLELALQREPAFKKEFENSRNNLSKISWSGELAGSSDSTGLLTRLLSEEWLSSSNIDHLCQPLHSELSQMRGSVIKVQSPYWMAHQQTLLRLLGAPEHQECQERWDSIGPSRKRPPAPEQPGAARSSQEQPPLK